MDSVAGTIRAIHGASGWTQPAPTYGRAIGGRSAAHVLAAAILHGLALWLVLTGAQKISPSLPPPPIVAQLIPPLEQSPPARREAPRQQPAEPRVPPKAFVPEPELSAPDTPSAFVDATQLTEPSVPLVSEPAAAGSHAEPGPAKPRGFGSISNRAACLAAFRDSYPREARRSRLEGSVTIAARIGADGRVMHAEVVNAQPRRVFDRAALNVLNAGACRFDADLDAYDWQAEISYRLDGESAE